MGDSCGRFVVEEDMSVLFEVSSHLLSERE
jgi:hypothetical protein